MIGFKRNARGRLFARVYGAPIALAFVGLGGLLSALFGDGIWDVLSWVALTLPLAAAAWFAGRAP
jgi:hypothetical protein